MDRCDMSMCDSIESNYVLRYNNTLYEGLYEGSTLGT